MDKVVVVILAIAVAVALFAYFKLTTVKTVFDFEKAIRYDKGVLAGMIGTGTYRYLSSRTHIAKYDMRPQYLSVAGQEMPTKDQVSVRLTLVGRYRITDLLRAVHATANFQQEMHTAIQLALREVVGNLSTDELLQSRGVADSDILGRVKPKLADIGIEVAELAIRDIVLPANLKKAMAGVLEAQKEAQKNLEKARGEQAVLRNLANAAKLFDGNPSLLQARLIQTLAQGGNTVVFGNEGIQITKRK
jgi:regulator of protease activity HflC (stomatin/prohibitin superfamily)